MDIWSWVVKFSLKNKKTILLFRVANLMAWGDIISTKIVKFDILWRCGFLPGEVTAQEGNVWSREITFFFECHVRRGTDQHVRGLELFEFFGRAEASFMLNDRSFADVSREHIALAWPSRDEEGEWPFAVGEEREGGAERYEGDSEGKSKAFGHSDAYPGPGVWARADARGNPSQIFGDWMCDSTSVWMLGRRELESWLPWVKIVSATTRFSWAKAMRHWSVLVSKTK
jgi:hypothetical protein